MESRRRDYNEYRVVHRGPTEASWKAGTDRVSFGEVSRTGVGTDVASDTMDVTEEALSSP